MFNKGYIVVVGEGLELLGEDSKQGPINPPFLGEGLEAILVVVDIPKTFICGVIAH